MPLCNGNLGGSFRGPNCVSQWEFSRFYGDATYAPHSPAPSPLHQTSPVTTQSGNFYITVFMC